MGTKCDLAHEAQCRQQCRKYLPQYIRFRTDAQRRNTTTTTRKKYECQKGGGRCYQLLSDDHSWRLVTLLTQTGPLVIIRRLQRRGAVVAGAETQIQICREESEMHIASSGNANTMLNIAALQLWRAAALAGWCGPAQCKMSWRQLRAAHSSARILTHIKYSNYIQIFKKY